ncbi:MAG: carbohydrate kinase, partial [Pseudomonadota bacterium]|nr:carbohydrate kinase [Pseudomonadota bacterium]
MISVGGENLIDLVSGDAAADGLPQYVANPGGSPFNVAMAASRQGLDVAYLTPVSEDALGELLADRLLQSRVKLVAPRVPHPTSLAVVSITDGIPSYAFHRNGTAERQVTMASLERDMPVATTLFHVGSLGLIEGDDADTWERFFANCQARGLMTSMDPNVRAGLISDPDGYVARIRRMMRHADIFKLSDEDLEWLYPDRSLDEALAACRDDCDAVLFILTLGGEGSRAFLGDIEIRADAPAVENLVDTVGAGDTFMATILS